MPNSGMFDSVTVTAPSATSSMRSGRPPVGARASSCPRVAGTIFGAFHDILSPERRWRAQQACPALTFSRPWVDGPPLRLSRNARGAAGAIGELAGMSAIHVHTPTR